MDAECSPAVPIPARAAIAARLRSIRVETHGEDGVAELARRLSLPARTCLNYESGVTIPGEVMLRFLLATGAEPPWLLEGVGERYRPSVAADDAAPPEPCPAFQA